MIEMHAQDIDLESHYKSIFRYCLILAVIGMPLIFLGELLAKDSRLYWFSIKILIVIIFSFLLAAAFYYLKYRKNRGVIIKVNASYQIENDSLRFIHDDEIIQQWLLSEIRKIKEENGKMFLEKSFMKGTYVDIDGFNDDDVKGFILESNKYISEWRRLNDL